METTSAAVPIASDSFSYSWLLSSNREEKSPLELGLDETTLRKSIHSVILVSDNSQSECRNFNFDTSITHHHSPFVHADELFSDGILRPVFASTSKLDSCNNSSPDPSQTKLDSSSSYQCSRTLEIHHHHHGFLKKWKKSTEEILVYFLRCVNQLCQKVRHSRKSNRVDDIDNKTEWQVKKSLSSSQQKQASPKSITIHPIVDLHDHENSIYEAVLHCKRSSIGK